MADELTRRYLDGLARHRASGAPALACLAGVRRVGTGLAADGAGSAGATDVAMLVDLAAGAGLRARLGVDRRLATTSLAVHLTGALPVLGELTVLAREPAAGQRLAVAGTTVLAGTGVLGHGVVSFAVLGDGLGPIPWEQDGEPDVPALTEQDLTPDERAGLVEVRSARGSWSEALLRAASPSGDELVPSALMANRAGGVQGGVLTGFAVRAAGDGWLRSVQVDFLAPAAVHVAIVAEVALLRDGRRARLLRVDLRQGAELVATATVSLARHAEAVTTS